jgi:hypothetical protein
MKQCIAHGIEQPRAMQPTTSHRLWIITLCRLSKHSSAIGARANQPNPPPPDVSNIAPRITLLAPLWTSLLQCCPSDFEFYSSLRNIPSLCHENPPTYSAQRGKPARTHTRPSPWKPLGNIPSLGQGNPLSPEAYLPLCRAPHKPPTIEPEQAHPVEVTTQPIEAI